MYFDFILIKLSYKKANKAYDKFLFFIYNFFSVALRPNAGHGLLNLEVSRSHTTTIHSR